MGDKNSTELRITFECKACGGAEIELPDNYTDDSIAICSTCKAPFGRFGDVKDEAINAARERIGADLDRAFRDAFRGVKGVTIK